jgi:type II secretory pathway pseudopilin PulG
LDLGFRKAFTLLEITIAISIFVFLSLLLVTLLGRAIDLWKSGENRGDLSERGQLIMEQLKKDIAGVFTEPDKRTIVPYNFDQSLPIEMHYLMEPSFYSGLDTNNNQWLYFIRLDDDNFYTYVSPTYHKTKERVIYCLDVSMPSEPKLVRGTVTETDSLNFWQQELEKQNQIPLYQITHIFDDVLYLGLDFSAASGYDSRKYPSLPPQAGAFPIVPQALPPTMKITLDIKPLPLNTPKITLAENISPIDTEIRINTAKTLLTEGSFIKIESEWLMVTKKTYYKLAVQRNERNTIPNSYNNNTEVQYGETIENTIYLPLGKTY